jgi:hypothetical protein
MFDDLEAQFFENVLPAYKAFIESLSTDSAGLNSDLRLGKDAAIALFHLREHVPWARGKPWPAFLSACPEYVLLQDVANAFKHGPRRDGQIASPSDIFETTVLTDYEDAEGVYHHAEKEVTIELGDGSRRDMKNVLSAVLAMWITEFKSRGLLRKLEMPKAEPHAIPSRRTANGAAPFQLTVQARLRFSRSFRRQRFNSATGQIEAIDMTGHNYQFSVYKPKPLELTVALTHPQTSARIEGTLELSPDETERYDQLTTDEERERFGATLARKYAGQLLGSSR